MRVKRRTKFASGVALPKMGRPTVIPQEEEAILAQCIGTLCHIGLSPTMDEIRIIVGEYINANNITSPFKNGIPGRQWLERFFKANKLTLKKATMISKERKDFTSKPFIIYDFYEQLGGIISSNDLQPNQIWNMDKTGFPLDPKKQMSVAPKGKRAYKTTQGSGRENITDLSVAIAAGRVLDPLIINQGTYFLESMKAENALPNTYYGVSAKGWMTSAIMLDWFTNFIEHVSERPLLLLFDGHLTHFSIDVIKKAIYNNIILMKLPPHVTDIMQPLDVGMFSPLKKAWENLLNKNISKLGEKTLINKSTFVSMLCSIWKDCMTPSNAVAGF